MLDPSVKISMTIHGTPSELASVLAMLGAGGTPVVSAPLGIHPNPAAPATPAPVPMPAPLVMPPAGDEDEGPTNNAAPAVDSNGLPWDARIHASTKALTEAGAWRKKRGVTDPVVAAVEAELRAAAQPAPVPMPATQPVPVPLAAPIPLPVAQPMQPPVPMPVPMPVPTPAVAPVTVAPDPAALDFNTFMAHVAGLMQKTDGAGAPLVHTDYLAQVTAEISGAFNTPLTAITDIANNPQMIRYAAQIFQRDQRW